MQVFCIRVGNKLGQLYEEYLKEKLFEYDFICIKEPYDQNVSYQWNKLYLMNLNIDEPICVINPDILLLNDYKQLFNTPIKQGQFIATPKWWENNKQYNIDNCFYKFYPKDCKYIYDKFISNIDNFQNEYKSNKFTFEIQDGEQYFIENNIKEKLELITVPNEWSTRCLPSKENNEKFDDTVKIVSFKNYYDDPFSIKKPHQWPHYKLYNTSNFDNTFYVADYKDTTKNISQNLYDLNFFIKDNAKHILEDFTFYEFTLEELGLPSADVILKGVKNVEEKVGLEGWKINGGENKGIYEGFSLTYNKDYFDNTVSPYHQTWGHKLQDQIFSGRVSLGKFKNQKNNYYDTFGFRNMHDIIYDNFKELIDRLNMPMLRSRVAYLWHHNDIYDNFLANWHVDEPSFEMLRINIPLQTKPEFQIRIKGSDWHGNTYEMEKHLEIGKAYIWNTNIPHAYGSIHGAPEDFERIHLVLGLSTYFDYDKNKDCFIKNSNYGMRMKDIVSQKLFVKKH